MTIEHTATSLLDKYTREHELLVKQKVGINRAIMLAQAKIEALREVMGAPPPRRGKITAEQRAAVISPTEPTVSGDDKSE